MGVTVIILGLWGLVDCSGCGGGSWDRAGGGGGGISGIPLAEEPLRICDSGYLLAFAYACCESSLFSMTTCSQRSGGPVAVSSLSGSPKSGGYLCEGTTPLP
ncbi:hypothetical protein PIB30_061878 [Stylosanthes scabra]|uniref:Secreted protein n=1 Tax=Stylosanthes scabra TaxID=79078 RepID=A0ABU6RKW8_9FABA|nr:hypothetical protein [Stylosanthes scabra]